tara:strand:+ start:304 stop:564 length:261 start_codon:yes stop_codon:yes gene_type:complete
MKHGVRKFSSPVVYNMLNVINKEAQYNIFTTKEPAKKNKPQSSQDKLILCKKMFRLYNNCLDENPWNNKECNTIFTNLKLHCTQKS